MVGKSVSRATIPKEQKCNFKVIGWMTQHFVTKTRQNLTRAIQKKI